MKKLLFILCGLAFNFKSLAQIHVNSNTTEVKTFYKSGKVKVIGGYYGDTELPDGIWTFYDENGKVTSQIEYKVSVKKFSNGRISEIGNWIHLDTGWAKFGTWTFYNESGEKIKTLKFNPFTPLIDKP